MDWGWQSTKNLPYKKLILNAISITIHKFINSQIEMLFLLNVQMKMQSTTHICMYTYTCTVIIPMQACAHRYLVLIDGTPYPVGRCFFSGRTLENFTEYSPCRDGKKNKNFVQHTHLCIFVNILIALVTIVVSIAICCCLIGAFCSEEWWQYFTITGLLMYQARPSITLGWEPI